jgi:large subunit ribosomal protein L5
MITKLSEQYTKKAIPAMIEKFHYKSKMAVPRIEKVVINTGFGKRIATKTNDEQNKICESISREIALIAGQAPVLTKSKKSISGFKLRKGVVVGAMVTLRGKKMNDFIERLIHFVLPRSRDFNGLSPKSIDESGNLSLAIREHIAFPEIEPEKAKGIFGIEITVVSNAGSKEKGLELFRLLGFPIKSN